MRRELRRASARPAFKSSQVKQASKLRLISLLAQVKSSQGKARQVSTSFVASAPHAAPTHQRRRVAGSAGVGCFRSVGLAGTGRSRGLPVPVLARPEWCARWSARNPNNFGHRNTVVLNNTQTHSPSEVSSHHTQRESRQMKRRTTYSENLVGRARVFFHFGGGARPPRRWRRSQRPARFTRASHHCG
jgi:hypothetical protein